MAPTSPATHELAPDEQPTEAAQVRKVRGAHRQLRYRPAPDPGKRARALRKRPVSQACLHRDIPSEPAAT